jgi:hypothetical protein
MTQKRNHSFNLRSFWPVILIGSICLGLCNTFIPAMAPGGLIMLFSTTVQSQEPNQANKPSEAAAARKKPATSLPADPSVNAVTQAAVKLGILSCVSRINQVATFLTANNKSGVYIFNPQKQPDQHIFSTSFELLRPDDSTLYASASFFPNQDAVYDTVEYVNIGCEELEKTVFKNLKRVSVLKKNIVLLDGGKVKVFLMPAGSGCVVIKKEVIP